MSTDTQGISNLISDWAQIPKGLHLIRMEHERTGHCLHLHLKVNDEPWYHQPEVPAAFSQEISKHSHREFWEWAAQTLPTWDHPELVRHHG